METVTTDIRRATTPDVPAVNEALGSAFQDDPVFSWIVPDAARRRGCLPEVFAAFADAYLPHGETYLAGGGTAVALWAPAGAEPIPPDRAEAFGERIGAALGPDGERAGELNAVLEAHHPTEPCFYLQFVGVAPEQRRIGLGSQLLVAVLQRCDATGTPAYLEATSVDNRRLYQRHGFDVVRELRAPGSPPLWAMWREPAGPTR